jgi:regulator of protease activity HflC (stomatin/prohibitin superfamily)
MVRAIARQAEAERMRRAKIINAEGEQQAAEKLVEAGAILARQPNAMQLRYLETVHDAASSPATTLLLPLPTALFDLLSGKGGKGDA